jgi:hypothetical protein
MPALRSREVAVAASGLALVVALSIGVAILAPPASETLPSGSSFSHQPSGSAAAYLTLERLGYTIRRSFDPLAAIAGDPASTVVILADPAEMPSNADRRALQSMVAAGATVLLTGCGARAFVADVGDDPGEPEAAEATPHAARLPSPLSAHAPRISMPAACASRRGAGFTALYGDEDAPVVRFRRSGRGLLVLWAGSTPISNAAIEDAGHLELLLNLAGPPGRAILWDEFYHGQRRSLYSYAKHTPLPWAAAQVLLVLCVAAAMYARRRAPILERTVESRASPLEFVDTMAGLYARADTAADAVTLARTRLRRLLAGVTGLAPDAHDDRLVAAAAGRRRVDAAELRAALAAAGGAGSGTLAARDALPLVRRLQACAAALERTGG